MTIFAVMVAVVSIWEYPQTLAKRPQVANRFGMVATTCDEEEPASVPAEGVAGHPLVLSGRNVGWDQARVFRITALGDDEYEFFQSHGDTRGVKIERLLNVAAVSIDRQTVSPTNRIDIAVVGKTAKSGWGAPSYVSFAVLDENAPYCDPTLVLKPVR